MKFPKSMGGWISLIFRVTGAVVAAGPLIVSVQGGISSGNFSNVPRDILYNYTGYSLTDGSFNTTRLGVGIASIVGGVALGKVGTILGRTLH